MRLALVVTAVSCGALAAVTLAPAKEGARARLVAPLPRAAAPETTIRVRWTVEFPGNDGGRPFDAIGMFVRVLSRTGAPATTGFDTAATHADGRYAASVRVPAGGIGGVRFGLRGSTDLLFPLDNDPFTSPGGVRCDTAAVRSTLTAFVRAYNRGDLRRLNRLFSRDGFVWYFAVGPDRHLRGAKQNRETLIPYFRARHRSRDRLDLRGFRFNGYDHERDRGHFQFEGRRRADDVRGGAWLRMGGKGALDCSRPPVTIALLLVGGET